MFRKLAFAVAVSALAAASASHASAAVSPTAFDLRVQGNFSQSISLTCNKIFSATASGSAIVVAANGQTLGTGCSVVNLNSNWTILAGPYNALTDSASLSLTGINATTSLGSCNQTTPLTSTWYNVPGSAAFAGAIAGTVFGFPMPCSINVNVTDIPPVQVTIN